MRMTNTGRKSGRPDTVTENKTRFFFGVPISLGLLLLSLPVMRDGMRSETFADTAQANTLAAGPSVIWRDPGAVELLDFVAGPGGSSNRPRGPFVFLKEVSVGRSPKIKVRDAGGREWVVKWGTEVKAEIIATRIAWASGYFVDSTYFVKAGRIEGIKNLGPANEYVGPDGTFKEARFE